MKQLTKRLLTIRLEPDVYDYVMSVAPAWKKTGGRGEAIREIIRLGLDEKLKGAAKAA